jgi:ketosteroid isomerase-like protein
MRSGGQGGPPLPKENALSTQTDPVNQYCAAFNRRDADPYARMFTADCELVAPGMRVTGIDAMRTFDRARSSAFDKGRIKTQRVVVDAEFVPVLLGMASQHA